MTSAALALAAILAQVAPPLAAETSAPAAPAQAAFIGDAIFACLTTQERQVPITGLPAGYRADLEPEPADSRAHPQRDPKEAVWRSRSAGEAVWLVEKSPIRCEVWAMGLSVTDTEERFAKAMAALNPPYLPAPVRAAAGDVARAFARQSDGRTIKVRIEGSEPGSFGHLSRLSLIGVFVTSGTP